MGKTGKKKGFFRRESSRESEHWLGHGIDGLDALLFDLDPYLFALDQSICRLAQQTAYSGAERYRENPGERPKAAILLGYDLNPWIVAFLSEKFDVALVSDYVDPIVEETAEHFNAILLDTDAFLNLEPVFDFVLRFECSRGIDAELVRTASEVVDLILPGGIALFPTIPDESIASEKRGNWIASSLGFRDFSEVALESVSLGEIKALPDYGATEFAKRHKAFYGKAARDLCLKRIYERDFQTALDSESKVELVVGIR